MFFFEFLDSKANFQKEINLNVFDNNSNQKILFKIY